jgi:aminopeptidase N
MDSQINQTGFPVISVSQKKDDVTLTQSRFLLLGEEEDKTLWKVPATMKMGKDKTHLIIEKKTTEVKTNSTDFIFLNENSSGFFITQYSPDLLKKLGENLQNLEDIEKIGLIHDLEKLTFSGKMKLNEFTEFLMNYCAAEKSTAVLLYMMGKLHKMYMLLKNKELGELLKEIAKLSINLTGYNPAAGEHPYTAFLRTSSLSSLALFDDADVKKFILDEFSAYLKDESVLHPDLRALVYALAVWFDDANYEIILNKFKQSTNIEEKGRFLSALGNSKNKELIQKSLAFVLTDDVRFNQMPALVFSVAGNPFGKDAAFDWLTLHWEDLKTKAHGTINHIFRNLLKVIIPSCGTGRMDEVLQFIQKNPTPQLSRTFDQSLEELEINDAFIKRKT